MKPTRLHLRRQALIMGMHLARSTRGRSCSPPAQGVFPPTLFDLFLEKSP
jgi:hypothetical protein